MRGIVNMKKKMWIKDMQSRLPAVLAVVLTACVPTTPRLDAQFGDAVNMARSQQTADPDASRNTDPVKGIDGQAGDAAVDNYRESYVNPRPALSGGVVNVGSGRAGSGGGMVGR
jgi:hypothetical protein